MFYYLMGKIALKEQNIVVIDCGGVGYKCISTSSSIKRLPEVGSEGKVFTYLHVREDIMDLYGFSDLEELNCFKLLLSVSKVGPKVAISVLDEMTPEKFAISVATSDYSTIKKANGVGHKMAQRIVLELKDKITKEQMENAVSTDLTSSDTSENVVSETIAALVVLGYSKSEAQSVLNKISYSQNDKTEDIIKKALAFLMR
ncbi:MAG: Holliday junction branch migration protein RuvA [Clostridia bacterium]|nr:Holliday junction branch migration protein RuvA [Clostridia bacterium]